MRDGYVTSPGDTVAEREAARDEYFAHNQVVEKLLEEKGFVMMDQAHVSARIEGNTALVIIFCFTLKNNELDRICRRSSG